ncbi:phage/plasmid primase, P4 family [Rhizobium straminoryzae]|uniref:DNA primase n=1 Tax=Rhizobium straminoryzae TaxID=1387186 RepID=A0A549T0U6_9HYPH|nr:phage/plasmid primase, P4 family [Rhizobium straminoryzae]TRL35507.1 DNA primase [Rhizobium straminoryzae]
MSKKKPPSVPEEVANVLAQAAAQREGYKPKAPDEEPAAAEKETKADPAVVEFCAELDHSDTDNARRLQLHFGHDLVVVAEEKSKEPLFGVWTGTHWDLANGRPKAITIAQRLGDRIAEEAFYVRPTEKQQALLDVAANAIAKPEEDRSPPERRLVVAAAKVDEDVAKRIKRRLDHAVASKNIAKLNAMLACIAPHIMRKPDDFNADKWTVAVKNATLTFRRVMAKKPNPRHRSVEETPDAPPFIEYCKSFHLDVIDGHRREDLITSIVPVRYDPAAQCPNWTAFIDSKLPDPDVRKLVQVSSGLGMLGVTVQYLFFHYGNGANGKSVYMETLARMMGEAAVTLPATSIIGEGGSSGGASPDIVRLYGKRLLRVKELPEGEPLRENLVKELTGGEGITARNLFSGYMDFEPKFIALMSGNGYPKITGTDDGIWRRMAVVHWPRQIAVEDRREFQEVVASFQPEYPGILNWLLEGVRIYLREGLIIPEAVRRATQDYRDDMDRTAAFVASCIRKEADAPPVSGKDLYQAYCDFTIDQGGRPMNLTAFGREMGKKFEKDRDSGIVRYRGIRLTNVPTPRAADPPAGRFDAPLPGDIPEGF